MATKVGSAYYEVFPKINQAAFAAVRKAIGQDLSNEFAKANKSMRAEATKTADHQIAESARVRGNTEKDAVSVGRANVNAVKDAEKEETKLQRIKNANAKTNEGIFHKTATQLRTIGTVTRGLAVGGAVLTSFRALQGTIGGIVAALPIAQAGLAAIPALISSAGVEGLILKGALSGVAKAIGDSVHNTGQLSKDMAKLNPQAAKFATTIIKAMKSLPDLQKEFFSAPQLQGAEKNLSSFFSRIHNSLAKVERGTGGLFGNLIGTATNGQNTKSINIFLNGLAKSLVTIQPGMDSLVTGFLKITAAGSGQGAKGLNTILDKFGKFLGRQDVGKLFDKANAAIHALTPTVKALGTVISSVFTNVLGGAAGGGTVFGALGAGLQAVSKFVKSGDGKKFEQQLGGTLGQLSSGAASIFGDALKILAGLLANLYPAIKPFVDQIKILGKELIPLGPLLGSIIFVALEDITVILQILNPLLKDLVGFLVHNTDTLRILVPLILAAYGATKLWAFVMEGSLIKGIGKLLNGLKLLIPLFGAVDAEADANPFGVIALGVAALAFGIFELVKHFDTVVKFMRGPLGTAILVVSSGLLGFVSVLIYVGLHWQAIWRFMLRVLHDVWSAMYHDVFNPMKTLFVKLIPGWLSYLGHWFASTFDGVRHRIAVFVKNDVVGALSSLKNFFIKTVPSWATSMKNGFLSVLHDFVSGIQNIWHKVADVFEKPIEFVINKVLNGGLIRAWNAVVSHIPIPGAKSLKISPFSNPGEPPTVAIPGGPATSGGGLSGSLGGHPKLGFAFGGMVPRGMGGPTQDNVPINVSGGEYIFSAKAVNAIGAPYLNALHSAGRDVSGDPSAAHVFPHGSSEFAAGGLVGNVGSKVGQTLAFLKGIAGVIPYIFGAVGPNGYDCSGLVGEVWARLTGSPSYRRYFTTGNEASFLRSHGFVGGPDPSGFTVGITNPPEHTAGMLAGHRFEAAHTGTKMRFDGGASNALNMGTVLHMAGVSGLGGLSKFLTAINKTPGKAIGFLGAAAKGLGNIPYAGGAGAMAAEALPNAIIHGGGGLANKALAGLVAQAASQAASIARGLGTPLGNLGPATLDKWIAEASKFTNIPSTWVPGIKTIIERESGGNPNAINRSDINAQRGDPSRGLMQTIMSTFNAYHGAGTSSNIFDPVANIVAAVNYIRARYGTIFRVQQANPNLPPHGYASGGPVLVRDNGGPLYPGMNHVWNGTGKQEWVNNPNGGGQSIKIDVFVDGVRERARILVDGHNNDLVQSLTRK